MKQPRIPNLLVFATGDKIGGGSGFLEMAERSRTKPAILEANIVGVVSNIAKGGVYEKALALGIPFRYWPGPFTAEGYQQIVAEFQADFVMCSGWLKRVLGLPLEITCNAHPAPLPRFAGLYGHFAHEAVMDAYHRGEITQSAFCMHFVNEEYDKGMGIVQIPVPIRSNDTPETLSARVLKLEHNYQSLVLNEIIHKRIFISEFNSVHFQDNAGLARFAFKNE